jgi:hypothetical protein
MADENKGIIPQLQSPQFALGKLGPKGLFAQSREIFRNAAAPPANRQNTGVACPECEALGVTQNPVWSTPNVGLQCDSGHKFRDTESLLSRPHSTVPVAKRTVVQEGWVTVQFQVAGSVAVELKNRYQDKEKLDATFAALCQHLIEPNMIMLSEPDIRRIADKVGQSVRSGQELYGIIFSLQENLNSTRDELRQKQANTPERATSVQLRRGELIVWFNPPDTHKLEEAAKSAGVSNEQFVEQKAHEALENGWWA